MSMNIAFSASRKIYIPGIDKHDIQTTYFKGVWQTPTDVSYKIKRADDSYQAYRNWVLTVSEPCQEPIYGPDDVWNEGPIIGYETFHAGADHIKDFDSWLLAMQEEGYTVEPEVW